jgi:hypothetical protein
MSEMIGWLGLCAFALFVAIALTVAIGVILDKGPEDNA